MYDGLYRVLDGLDVQVVVRGDHPTLNREVAARLGRGERLDLISTHSKYAPSQAPWLHRLDGILDPAVLHPLAPKAVELCRFKGSLLSVPRNIDVRVLWANREMLGGQPVPATWAELLASSLVFGFPGRDSGLFGTFFEIVTANGGRLFDNGLRPTMATSHAVQAVESLMTLANRAPSDLPDWHYDQVDAALGSGRVACAAAWPGATGALRASACGKGLEPYPYLSGPFGMRSYAGCHSWAIPKTSGDIGASLLMIERLCSATANMLEAESGAVCAHVDVFGAVRGTDEIDARRLDITRRTIANGMITYPPLERFPEIEDAGWGALHRALRGEIDASAAVALVQAAAQRVLG